MPWNDKSKKAAYDRQRAGAMGGWASPTAEDIDRMSTYIENIDDVHNKDELIQAINNSMPELKTLHSIKYPTTMNEFWAQKIWDRKGMTEIVDKTKTVEEIQAEVYPKGEEKDAIKQRLREEIAKNEIIINRNKAAIQLLDGGISPQEAMNLAEAEYYASPQEQYIPEQIQQPVVQIQTPEVQQQPGRIQRFVGSLRKFFGLR